MVALRARHAGDTPGSYFTLIATAFSTAAPNRLTASAPATAISRALRPSFGGPPPPWGARGML